MTSLTELISHKSSLILELERAKLAPKRSRKFIAKLASESGTLESVIAHQLVASGSKQDAVVNLISAGSCFRDASRWVEAERAFRLAMELASTKKIRSFIQHQLAELESYIRQRSSPGLVFTELRANIGGNQLLRKPQIDAYEAAKSHFANKNDHAIIQLPVGCGKTGVMALLPFGISQGRALVVAPNLEIAQNIKESFDYSSPNSFIRRTKVVSNGRGPTCAVLDSQASIHDADASDFVVGNVQQLVAGQGDKWLAQFPPDYFDLILFDEGHHNAADSWKRIHEQFSSAKLASFTATPLRSDGKKVEGTPIYRFPITEAIREGYIKDIASRRLEPSSIEFVYRGSKQRHSLAEVLKLRENEWFSKGVALASECNKHIVDAAIQCMNELRHASNFKHQIIAAACSIDHARSICSLFRERGLEAEILHSKQKPEEKNKIRNKLKDRDLDAIVHVQMLGEGADYPALSIAAIFRPYRHLVPYIQFIGRVMRVIRQNAPGDPVNRGFVISHVGLHIDRWWEELRSIDKDDQLFFEALANSTRDFQASLNSSEEIISTRRRFTPSMQVIDEHIACFVQEHFLDRTDASVMIEDLRHAMELRGFDLPSLGLSEEDLIERLIKQGAPARGELTTTFVQPQRARQEARRRLNERVRAGAKQLLNELGLSPAGRKLMRLYPSLQAQADLSVAIILLNLEVNKLLDIGDQERDLLTERQCSLAYNEIDSLIDNVAEEVKAKLGTR